LDRAGRDRTEAGEETPRQPEMVKERETKEDGRYIIFYSFGDDEEVQGDG
jgi:hypothetical protein